MSGGTHAVTVSTAIGNHRPSGERGSFALLLLRLCDVCLRITLPLIAAVE
jgi:hypothetical protein